MSSEGDQTGLEKKSPPQLTNVYSLSVSEVAYLRMTGAGELQQDPDTCIGYGMGDMQIAGLDKPSA